MPEAPLLRASVVQEAETGRVLMLGWMSEEALRLTEETGVVHFYSRSRQCLWQKGETSGHRLHVVEILRDCDDDAVLVKVRADGPACHTGTISCFVPWLWRTVRERAAERPPGAYTTSLLEAGVERVAQKVGEEAVEVVIAAVSGDRSRTVEEVADLWYHCLVLLAASGIDLTEVEQELEDRRSRSSAACA